MTAADTVPAPMSEQERRDRLEMRILSFFPSAVIDWGTVQTIDQGQLLTTTVEFAP